jgi:7,8-dihydropterin-6-yl-methyl-4-(beta-D-ribofuranosyl)aminobenzene 5'-phosphate synthase
VKTTLTVLCENTAGIPLRIVGEHGLAVLIERGEEQLLFDTGQGIGLFSNAAFLGKDLSRVKRVVVSHGHYDHTGGLAAFVEKSAPVTVFGHPDVFRERFARRDDDHGRHILPIGIPFSRKDLEAKGAAFDLSPAFREIVPGVFASGEIPRPEGWRSWDPRLIVRDGDRFEPDPFWDDLSLVLETDKGPVLLLGCAHAGLSEIIHHLRRESGHEHFHAIVGGTHLGTAEKRDWEEALALLEECQVQLVATSHCTGFHANCFLTSRLGERLVPAYAGASFEF